MRITPGQCEALIEERYRKRGEAYFRQGMVELLRVTEKEVQAKCLGTRLYRVRLFLSGYRLDGSCTCEAFRDFGPCKHLAATIYAVQAHDKSAYKPSPTYKERAGELDILEKVLRSKKKDELVGMLIEMLSDDPDQMYALLDEAGYDPDE